MGVISPIAQARPTREAVRPALERMVDRAGFARDEASRFWRIFDLLTRESLDFAPSELANRFSGICRDGTPWQFCAVTGSPSLPIRFLTEVGCPQSRLRQRTALTLIRIAEVFELVGAPGYGKIADVLAGLTPQDDDHIAGLWVGVAVGAAVRPRLRLYANNGWGDTTARWLRLIGAMRRLNAGQFGASLQPLVPLLLPAFSPVGFAVTVPASPLLCKLYLRPIGRPWSAIRELARTVLASRADGFIAAIENGMGRPLEALPDRAVLVSVAGFASGGPLDLKLDLCGHCLFNDDTEAAIAIERLSLSLALDASPYRVTIEDLGEPATLPGNRVAFVGVGGNANGGDRINVYLAPSAFA
jgi:hypothetical protein